MKQFFLWAVACVLILSSCGKGTTFTVKGKFADNSADSTVLLLQVIDSASGQPKVVDSAIVKNGEFVFKGDAKGVPDFNVIVPQNPTQSLQGVMFVREPGTIKINIQSADSIIISGTKINDQFQKMQTQLLALNKEAMTATSEDAQKGLAKKAIGIYYDYAKENMQNPTGEQIFASVAMQLTSAQVNELVKKSRPSFSGKEQVKTLQKTVEAKEKMEKNKQYEDISLVDANGQTVALSTYVGKSKYVLIDFWASWCAPCVQEMPNIVAAYAKYKAKGLEVVSISVDQDKDAWLKGVKENNMTWIQLNDVKGNGSAIYGVESIPHTLLIDQNGKIVAQNLRGEDLDAKLSELMPE